MNEKTGTRIMTYLLKTISVNLQKKLAFVQSLLPVQVISKPFDIGINVSRNTW